MQHLPSPLPSSGCLQRVGSALQICCMRLPSKDWDARRRQHLDTGAQLKSLCDHNTLLANPSQMSNMDMCIYQSAAQLFKMRGSPVDLSTGLMNAQCSMHELLESSHDALYSSQVEIPELMLIESGSAIEN